MIFRLLIIGIIIGATYYILRNLLGTSAYKKCGKCNGKGYWIAMRGVRDKCDICKGSGKILR